MAISQQDMQSPELRLISTHKIMDEQNNILGNADDFFSACKIARSFATKENRFKEFYVVTPAGQRIPFMYVPEPEDVHPDDWADYKASLRRR